MHTFTAALLPLALCALPAHGALADDGTADYLNSVCLPSSEPTAPCISIGNIETACLPNGTSALAFEAHAQCMCGGSYFAEWLGCRRCLLDHGGLSERDLSFYQSVLSTASDMLCTGTPTAQFADLFNSAQATVPVPTTGATALSDVSSGDGAVSLYYTATGSSGPGKITGSATAATTKATTAVGHTSTQGPGATGSTATKTGASTTAKTSSSTSTSSNVAAPTGAVGGKLLFAVAGGALMAAL